MLKYLITVQQNRTLKKAKHDSKTTQSPSADKTMSRRTKPSSYKAAMELKARRYEVRYITCLVSYSDTLKNNISDDKNLVYCIYL